MNESRKVLEEWQEFNKKYRKVLDDVTNNMSFKEIGMLLETIADITEEETLELEEEYICSDDKTANNRDRKVELMTEMKKYDRISDMLQESAKILKTHE